jgi:hypothetical protein
MRPPRHSTPDQGSIVSKDIGRDRRSEQGINARAIVTMVVARPVGCDRGHIDVGFAENVHATVLAAHQIISEAPGLTADSADHAPEVRFDLPRLAVFRVVFNDRRYSHNLFLGCEIKPMLYGPFIGATSPLVDG